MKSLIEIISAFLRRIFGGREKGTETVVTVIDKAEEDMPVNEIPEEDNTEIEVVEEEEESVISGMSPEPPVNSTMRILVDNGHGNNTAGKRCPYLLNGELPAIEFFEYKWNREIAKRIVDDLQSKGYNAELLVTELNDVTLSERVMRVNKLCKEVGTDNVIFLSIHANAYGTNWNDAKGWSAFTSVGKTKSDKIAEFLYDEAEKNFVGRKIRTDKSDGDRDWESNFFVLKNTMCPAVLTENFFFTNVDDVNYIMSEEGKNAVVKTHVDGIINYIKSI